MNLTYIAAPYRATTIVKLQVNIESAKMIAQYYWINGSAVICPHLNTANFDGLVDDQVFLDGMQRMLLSCNHAVFHPDFRQSKGCCAEFVFAKEHNIKTIQLTHFELDDIKNFVTNHIRNLQ